VNLAPSQPHASAAYGGGVPPIGAVLDGKYRVESLLAEGGMGIVILATQLQLARRVAIKFLRATARQAEGVLEQFEREAKLAAQIKSEHVVRVHDVGVLPALGPYMVMEYLEGENLGSLLGHGPLPVPEAVDYVLQACDALAEIHALEIVHRDVKPDNLFLARRPPHAPIVKLIDFGISKATPRRGARGEWTSETLGTPAYMSPEQLDTGVADERGDIWSLGVVLYELVTGRLPFDAPDLPELCTNILTTQPTRPSQLRPDLPIEIERAILRCLAKDPAERIGSVLDLAQLIGPYARPANPTNRVERVALASRPVDPSRAAKTMLVARKQRTWIPAALAVCAFLAISGGTLGLFALKAGAKKPTTAAVPMPTEAPAGTAQTAPSAATASPTADSTLELAAEPALTPSATATPGPRPTKKLPSPRPASDPRAGFGERR
jgi:serine/threonine-protein kinase